MLEASWCGYLPFKIVRAGCQETLSVHLLRQTSSSDLRLSSSPEIGSSRRFAARPHPPAMPRPSRPVPWPRRRSSPRPWCTGVECRSRPPSAVPPRPCGRSSSPAPLRPRSAPGSARSHQPRTAPPHILQTSKILTMVEQERFGMPFGSAVIRRQERHLKR